MFQVYLIIKWKVKVIFLCLECSTALWKQSEEKHNFRSISKIYYLKWTFISSIYVFIFKVS